MILSGDAVPQLSGEVHRSCAAFGSRLTSLRMTKFLTAIFPKTASSLITMSMDVVRYVHHRGAVSRTMTVSKSADEWAGSCKSSLSPDFENSTFA